MSQEAPVRPTLSDFPAHICIVASQYNERYTQALVDCCVEELRAILPSVQIRIIRVPGAFEIPVTIRAVLSQEHDIPHAVVALGVILRGKTDHADLIGNTITQALMQLALDAVTPVIHEVLLLHNEDQAEQRCLGDNLNRGREAARTAARMAELMMQIK